MKNRTKKWLALLLAVGILGSQSIAVLAENAEAVPVPESEIASETVQQEPEIPIVNDMSKYNAPTSADRVTGKWVYDKSAGKWWVKCSDGSYPANAIYKAGGTTYGFDESGWMITGWHYYYQYGSWFYFNENGAMVKGWLWDDGAWYYLDPTGGYMYYSGLYEINGATYGFTPSGVMLTGWYKLDDSQNSWIYFDGSGAQYKDGWLWEGGSWYYLAPQYGGIMLTGMWKINDTVWILDDTGRLANGWRYLTKAGESHGYWVYANPDGTPYSGWLCDGGTWYHIDNGWMDEEMILRDESDGKCYFLQIGGAMAAVPGWYALVYDDGTIEWYYVKNASGELYTNGTYKIKGAEYTFDDWGVQIR